VVAGSTVPNLVLTGLGAGGQVDIYNNAGQVDVVVDGFGWFPGPTPAGSPVPCPTASATVVTRGRTDRRAVALTFDAGSDSGNTTRILDTLAAEQVPASFALTGAWARANPELAARIGTYADVILNHSDNHPSFTGYSTGLPALTTAERRDQLARAETAIVAATGRAARPWFRPPYGDRDASVDRDIGAAGYRYDVMWTIDSFGWKGVPPATVVSRVLTNAVPGAIVVMHVGAASTDIDALVDVIGGLRADGYELVSLPALLGVAAT
jgi:peptidoglycan/xylan/chitin deacetylase (PgdA/CDA1 family)